MSQEQLTKLTKKRTQIKTSVTRFRKYIDSVDRQNLDVIDIQERINNFQKLLAIFDETQSSIELLNEDEFTSNAREEFENNYYGLLSCAKRLVLENQDTNNTAENSGSSRNSGNINNQIRLPKIELPTFDGNYDQWYSFYESFDSLINSNEDIMDVQKLHYLRSSLRGNAKDLILSLDITSQNYAVAWELLKNRYDNKRLIIKNHVRALFDVPSITRECSSGLRKILDTTERHIRALKALGRPTEHWDDVMIHLLSCKIDDITNREWESSLEKGSIPNLNGLISFISHKCQTLEGLSKKSTSHVANKIKSSSHVAINKNSCAICKHDHSVQDCDVFLKMNVEQRIREAKTKRLCLNCFKTNHITYKCLAAKRCNKCHKKHNTLVHADQPAPPQTTSHPLQSANQTEDATTPQTLTNNSCLTSSNNSIVLLSTAIVHIKDTSGVKHECRILLDSGSQSNFITTAMAKKMGLRFTKINLPVMGINQSTSMVNWSVSTQIFSTFNNFKFNLNCLVLEKITENLPLHSFNRSQIEIPGNIKLADPKFNTSNNIDMLIGAGVFWNLLCVGKINLPGNQLALHKTHLGWIVAGSFMYPSQSSAVCNLSTRNLDQFIRRFWELEECSPELNKFTPEENACEAHFVKTVTRNSEGRFIVRLPFKDDVALGNSKEIALKQFKAQERRLNKQPELKKSYVDFMKEYETLGHMTLAKREHEDEGFYMPHHAVLKETSITTKLRVVFNGSSKTNNGISLNDTLMVGPKIQQDLFSVLVRFRTHKFVLSADITKMYRQVLVHHEDRKFQKILWRANETEKVQCYELNTVTYGTGPASFLAIRCLHELAEDYKDLCPKGAQVIINDFYVDDMLTGANTESEAIQIRNEVTRVLASGGMELRKWATNNPNLLIGLDNSTKNTVIDLDKEGTVKTLGLQWNSAEDILQYSVPALDNSRRISKRTILSDIAQVFDPLGLINPIIVTAKIIVQQLWQLKLDWDESVPTDIHTKWFYYRKQFETLRQYKIPRHVMPIDDVVNIEMHGFCDASESAYGACVYIRVSNDRNEHRVQLLASKSRVAPLKATTVPRLELCGAVLLATLMCKTMEALNNKMNRIYCWTDSSIVLAWINAPSKQWDTFVSNRVSVIQQYTDSSSWHHVSSEHNPADILSRGSSPEQLKNSSLWWFGPKWLVEHEALWTKTIIELPCEIPERRRTNVNIATIAEPLIIYERFSSYTKLIRSVAYALRFLNRCKGRKNEHKWLTSSELAAATNIIIKDVQRTAFAAELNDLKQLGCVSSKSTVLSLNPFLDNSGIIRVGGRLHNSQLPTHTKHPILLSASHYFTSLVITHYHSKLLHSGIEGTLAGIRTQYWPLAARSKVRHLLRKCVICFKSRPKVSQTIMGNLPKSRMQPVKPFTNCGVDYFGPLLIKEKRRNAPAVKAYGAVFICFSTRAVHLELVSSLSTEAFLAALTRMISRRGKISNIYSDNGTNFVGANKELRMLTKLFRDELHQQKLSEYFSSEGISWHFMPPYSPHFGGMWEAAVKSAKTHIKKVAGNSVLTFEEMYTLLTKIECVLNSRPLTQISSDSNDLSFLTPGHFLVGDALTAIPNPSLLNIPSNKLSRWQLVHQLLQHFWTRWKNEYLHNLQQRTKWKLNKGTALQSGQLVVIREDNLPPMHWKMGRIVSVHPGNDGVARVATIKTSGGVVKRAAARLCILPVPVLPKESS